MAIKRLHLDENIQESLLAKQIKQTQLLLTYDLLSPVACVWLCSNSHVLKNQIKLAGGRHVTMRYFWLLVDYRFLHEYPTVLEGRSHE